ncbi:MAG: hypothetical protein ACOC5A_00515 [Halanaerobiales bacterium]
MWKRKRYMYGKKYNSSLIICIFVIILFGFSLTALGAEYVLDADKIDYEYESGHIHARGNAYFESADLKIEAGELVIIPEDNLVRGLDGVTIITGERSLAGESLEFDYDREQGSVYGASGELDTLRFTGGEIELNRERKDDWRVYEASLTPCILEEPHYRLEADAIYLYPGEKVVGKGISFIWGETEILGLPGYTIPYDDEGRLQPVLPEIGYDSETGLSLALEYPYQIGSESSGMIKVEGFTKGDQLLQVDNQTRISPAVLWKSRGHYDREEQEEYNKTEGELQTGLEGKVNENISFSGKASYRLEEEETESEEKILAAGADYTRGQLTISSLTEYDFVSGVHWSELDTSYKGEDYEVNMYHRFKEDSQYRQSYNLSSRWKNIDIQLDYREGYDMDYLPRINLRRDFYDDYRIELEAAEMKEDRLQAGKLALDMRAEKQFSFDNFSLDLDERVHYNSYNNEEDTTYVYWDNFAGINYHKEVSEKIGGKAGINWDYTRTAGDYLFSVEEVEEKNNVGLNGSLEFKTDQPESAWVLGVDSSYSFIDGEWDRLGLELTRRLDCYSLSFEYDFADRNFGLGMKF